MSYLPASGLEFRRVGFFNVVVVCVTCGRVNCTLPSATMAYPYIPRSISWHPTQHMIAVAMVSKPPATQPTLPTMMS